MHPPVMNPFSLPHFTDFPLIGDLATNLSGTRKATNRFTVKRIVFMDKTGTKPQRSIDQLEVLLLILFADIYDFNV